MTKIIKSLARRIVFPLIHHLRIHDTISSSGNKRMILAYHGVTQKEFERQSGKPFPASVFESHLKYFKNNYQVVSVKDIFTMYREKIIPDKKTIALTFDDGYENNYTVVYPLLIKYGIPATFYVSAACLSDPDFILWNDLVHIFSLLGTEELLINGHIFKKAGACDYYDFSNDVSIHTFLKQLSPANRDEILDALQKRDIFIKARKILDSEMFRMLKKNQIRELAGSSLVDIGSHGYSHLSLGNIDADSARKELTRSKQLLEEATEKEVTSIAYPDGSYNEMVKKISLEIGYKDLCAVSYKLKEDYDDSNILERHMPSPTTTFYSNMFFLHKGFSRNGF